jgi:hypothetical protein
VNAATRFALIAACLIVCAAGFAFSHLARGRPSIDGGDDHLGATDLGGDYQFAADALQKPSFKELESLIRHEGTAMAAHARIEFGSVKMEQRTAVVEVLFFAPDGQVRPFLYKLAPENNSWKVVSAQRMWFVPRSHLLRGVRV